MNRERAGPSVWNGKRTCLSWSSSLTTNVGRHQWPLQVRDLRAWPVRGQERRAVAHKPEPTPAAAFISGYTDPRNEEKAPNALLVSFSLYTVTTLNSPPLLFPLPHPHPLPAPAFYTAKELQQKNNMHSNLSVKSIQTGYRKAGVIRKQHLYVITWVVWCSLALFHRSAEGKSFSNRQL